jgi:hypothetical protein
MQGRRVLGDGLSGDTTGNLAAGVTLGTRNWIRWSRRKRIQ